MKSARLFHSIYSNISIYFCACNKLLLFRLRREKVKVKYGENINQFVYSYLDTLPLDLLLGRGWITWIKRIGFRCERAPSVSCIFFQSQTFAFRMSQLTVLFEGFFPGICRSLNMFCHTISSRFVIATHLSKLNCSDMLCWQLPLTSPIFPRKLISLSTNSFG